MDIEWVLTVTSTVMERFGFLCYEYVHLYLSMSVAKFKYKTFDKSQQKVLTNRV